MAMMLATIAALNQYRGQIRTEEEMIRSEYEIMANAVAIEQIQILDIGTDWEDLEDVDGDTMQVSSVPYVL